MKVNQLIPRLHGLDLTKEINSKYDSEVLYIRYLTHCGQPTPWLI